MWKIYLLCILSNVAFAQTGPVLQTINGGSINISQIVTQGLTGAQVFASLDAQQVEYSVQQKEQLLSLSSCSGQVAKVMFKCSSGEVERELATIIDQGSEVSRKDVKDYCISQGTCSPEIVFRKTAGLSTVNLCAGILSSMAQAQSVESGGPCGIGGNSISN